MSGIKTYVQTDLRVAPTKDTHLVRMRDMMEFVNSLTTEGVRAALTTSLDGSYNALNQVLTATLNAAASFIVDGVAVVPGNRILLAGQLDKTQNGIYVTETIQVNGADLDVRLMRAGNFNDSVNIRNGLTIPILEGNSYGGERFKTVLGGLPFVLDTTNIEFHKIVADLTHVVEAVFDLIGDDATMVYDLNHGWDTKNVTHEMYDSQGNTVVGEFRRTSANDVRVSFGIPLGVGNDLTIVLRAEVDPA